jgi:hypothetical protein
MTDIDARALDRELKKGSAELLILSLLDARPRHGYELSKQIETRSRGQLTFHIDSLYPLLYRLEERGWIKGPGRRRPASAAAGSTRSPRKDGACSRGSARRGRPSWRRSVASRRANMPDWAPEVRQRLSSLHLSPTREIEIVEELSQHLDDRYRELVAGGASPEEATRLTLASFTDANFLARHMAPLRQSRALPPITPGATSGNLLGDVWQDVRHALRTMAARPGFTIVAVVSLALGIGANTAIFSVWNGLLHAALPAVQHPEQLVMLSNPNGSGSWTGRADGVRSWLTYEEFEQLRDHVDSFSEVMASQSSLDSWPVRFEGEGSEEASGRLVSGGFFHTLGVGAAIGRVFTAADDRVARPDVVISYGYWQRRFGGRPDVLGKTLTVRKATLAIVGVAARGFIGETSGQQPDMWLPLRMQPAVLPGRDRLHDTPPSKSMWLNLFGRLKPGVTPAQAEAQANAVFQRGLETFYGGGLSSDLRREVLNQRLPIHPGGRGATPPHPHSRSH